MVDCRLEYRALLEAYSPGKPPLEIAQQFLDKLSCLQKAWYALKKGREELEKELKKLPGAEAAKAASTEEEQVKEAADRAVAFAEKGAKAPKKAKSAAPAKVSITPAVPKKAKASSRPSSGEPCKTSPSSSSKAKAVIDVEGQEIAGSAPKGMAAAKSPGSRAVVSDTARLDRSSGPVQFWAQPCHFPQRFPAVSSQHGEKGRSRAEK